MPRASTQVNFEQGSLRPTGDKNDLAIEGPGFFEVQLPSGTTAFTRDGELSLNSLGQLVTKQGYQVMGEAGPIQLDPNNAAPLSIGPNGDVAQGADLKGRIKLTEFSDRSQLTPVGTGLFTDNSAALQGAPATDSRVRQGFLEAANTSVSLEMAHLMVAMRSFEAAQRMTQIQDERVGATIRELTPQ
jgi:flagellar basal-body rod protein FlgG